MIKNYIVAWACDFSNFKGEGILAREFLLRLSKIKKKNFYVKSNDGIFRVEKGKIKQIKKRKFKVGFVSNYITPFYGILFLWFNYLTKKKILYFNYLPLWNFLIFLLTPPSTIFGPITGGSLIAEKGIIKIFIRKYFFNFLYLVSILFINIRGKSIIFSTDLLMKYRKFLLVRNKFLFCLSLYKKIKPRKKNIDLLIYNRVHNNKGTNKLLEKIQIINVKKAFCVGDKIKNKKITNLGNLSREKLMKILSKTKYTLNNDENYLSLFLIDSITNKATVCITKKQKKILKYFSKKSFVFYDLKKKKILNQINTSNHDSKVTSKKILEIQNDLDQYISNFFEL